MDKWISVKDRLPEDGQNCILYYPENNPEFVSGEYDNEFNRWYYAYEEYSYRPAFNELQDGITHWMPMPDPPEDK